MQTETIKVSRPGRRAPSMDAFVAMPDGDGRHPGVVVIHELFGLNDNMRDIAQRFAAAGYVALAIDLFSGAPRPLCLARVFAGLLVRPLHNSTVLELQSAIDSLQARPEVDEQRIGVVGFCMGGAYALQLACVDASLRAASVFYGNNPRPLDAVAQACPIVGSYPDRDLTTSDARKLDAALERFNVPHDIKIYPNTQHSFFNDRGRSHDAEASADSWTRMLAFFADHLRADREVVTC